VKRVPLPADVELEDQLAFGLTVRQLAILAAAAVSSYCAYAVAALRLPDVAAMACGLPLALSGVLIALGRFDGLTGDRFAIAVARFLCKPRMRLLAPEGVARVRRSRLRLAPLPWPLQEIGDGGLLRLERRRYALILRASGPSFALRGVEEQAALVGAFGRFLNGLVEPVSIIVRSEAVALAPAVDAVLAGARQLAPGLLRDAAAEHAAFLRELGERTDVRRREILLVLTTHGDDDAAAQATLERRAQQAQELLRGAGIELRQLDGDAAETMLARATSSPGRLHGVRLSGVIRAC
jgi:hypothetical protein